MSAQIFVIIWYDMWYVHENTFSLCVIALGPPTYAPKTPAPPRIVENDLCERWAVHLDPLRVRQHRIKVRQELFDVQEKLGDRQVLWGEGLLVPRIFFGFCWLLWWWPDSSKKRFFGCLWDKNKKENIIPRDIRSNLVDWFVIHPSSGTVIPTAYHSRTTGLGSLPP